MIFEEAVAPGLQAGLQVVGAETERPEIAAAFQKAVVHARETLDRLDPLNPAGETFRLTGQIGRGTYSVSPDLARILQTSREVAAHLKEPLAKKLEVDLEKNEVTFNAADILINIEPLLKGYLADLLVGDMEQAGRHDLFLQMGGIHIARGRDFNGPWKIPVVDDTTASAHHVFLYKANNVAAATVDIHDKNLAGFPSDLKSVTVFSQESACRAQGMAAAAFAAGLNNAKKMLKVAKATSRSVLIDQSGKFVQIPEQ